MIHPLSDVQTKNIGDNTNIWQYCVVLPGAKIGKNCNICSHCFIENDVIIGDNVTIKNGVHIFNATEIENNAFIGQNAVLCHDRHPKSGNKNSKIEKITVKKYAVVGAGAVILPGVTIGENATVGAGAVVTKDAPPSGILAGNPARILRYKKVNEVWD